MENHINQETPAPLNETQNQIIHAIQSSTSQFLEKSPKPANKNHTNIPTNSKKNPQTNSNIEKINPPLMLAKTKRSTKPRSKDSKTETNHRDPEKNDLKSP